ncbi:hypothetical protein RHMOL_Rhmol10G0086300 [Rhododendron molle]|uniref:Uncharacterized protein n=1 Tax=Rhododendron molle TaxID=49168 RepID=A0ACC0M1H6_RHOML|nr:hypothetical protein RHMOL_Rhmol10G0086300 [Rhododendron molle]
MLPLAMQPSSCCSFHPSTLAPHFSSASKLVPRTPFNNSIAKKGPNPSSFQSSNLKFNRDSRSRNPSSLSSASSAATFESIAKELDPTQPVYEKLGVVVKPMQKSRLVLKFMWMEKNIGLALDQVIPGHVSIPLSPYYFWPRKDAWDELKILLESKPWISQRQMVILLNQATDVINLWQQSADDHS